MKKIILVLLLAVPMIVQSQKIMIKTGSGQIVEISCEGTMPSQITVSGDSVVVGMPTTSLVENKAATQASVADDLVETDSVDTFVAVTNEDTLPADSLATHTDVVPTNFVDALVQEYSPEYKAFNEEAQTKTALQAVEEAATPLLGEEGIASLKEVGETVSWISSLIKPKAGFNPDYLQRKMKTANKRAYTDVKVFASMGKELSDLFGGDKTPELNEGYGTDAENSANYGAALQITRQTCFGRTENGKFVPGPFRLYWGGLAAIDFEKEIGVSADLFATGGFGVGNDISLEVGALAGFAFNSYNTFLTNYVNYMTVTQHKMCFAIGLQACLTLNLSKDVYTGIWGRTAYSFKPAHNEFNLQKGWEVEYEDFNQDAVKFGLFMGFKINPPTEPSTDKRLKFSLSYANQFIGESGSIIAAELERQTQMSPIWTINYGLEVARRFSAGNKNYSSVMASAGVEKRFTSMPSLSLEGKIYAGVGECNASTIVTTQTTQIEDLSPRICGKAAIQLGCQYRIGKASYLSLAFRLGHYIGRKGKIESEVDDDGDGVAEGENEGEDASVFDVFAKQGIQAKPETSNNISGWTGHISLGYKFVF